MIRKIVREPIASRNGNLAMSQLDGRSAMPNEADETTTRLTKKRFELEDLGKA
jgi:hypothetical protein